MDTALAVILPAFNEAATLGRVLRRVLLQPCVQQVLVVDDGSTDGTSEVAERFLNDVRLTVLKHSSNRGKGAAIRTAIDAVHAPIVVTQDADLEYDPIEYAAMIAPIVQRRADAVYGLRGLASHPAYSYLILHGYRLVHAATNGVF